jgi:hypothetical protein
MENKVPEKPEDLIRKYKAMHTKPIERNHFVYDQYLRETENAYLKFYKFSDEGLRRYGELQKKKRWTILKWSFMGTTIGVILSAFIELKVKKMNPYKKDWLKAGILFICVAYSTGMGILVASTEAKKATNELIQQYGIEILDEKKNESI